MTKKPEAESGVAELVQQALVPVEEQPYKVPANWLWVRMGSLINLHRGVSFKKDDASKENYGEKILILRGGNIDEGNLIFEDNIYVGRHLVSEHQLIQKSDIVIVGSTGSKKIIGKAAIVDNIFENVAFGAFLILVRVHETLNKRFIAYFFLSERYRNIIRERANGVNINNIRGEHIQSISIPLPPLPEQQRIVNVIEALFAKLDRAKELLEEVQEAFEEQKATILARAFRGELTAKWREENIDDASSKILNILFKQRMDLAKNEKEIKEIKKAYMGCFLTNDTYVHNGWIKIKASLICENITCGNTPTGNIVAEGDIPFLKVYNIVNNAVDFIYKPQFIDCETHSRKLKSSKLMPGDVIMNIVGPPLRKIAIIPNDYPEWNMNQAIVRFRPVSYVDSKYLYYCLLNPSTLDEVIRETKGVVGQANISITQSRNLDIPVPPIQEQKEIVRILDDLLDQTSTAAILCDQMEQIEQLKKTILAKAFRGELNTNDPAEESAEKLLWEVLRQRAALGTSKAKVKRMPKLPKAIETENAKKSLENIIRTSGKMSSAQLFKQSGIKDIQAFYSRLKEALESGGIIETRDESGRNVFFEVKP